MWPLRHADPSCSLVLLHALSFPPLHSSLYSPLDLTQTSTLPHTHLLVPCMTVQWPPACPFPMTPVAFAAFKLPYAVWSLPHLHITCAIITHSRGKPHVTSLFGQGRQVANTHNDVKVDCRSSGLDEGDRLRVAVLRHEELLPLPILQPVAPFFPPRSTADKT